MLFVVVSLPLPLYLDAVLIVFHLALIKPRFALVSLRI